MNNIIKGSFLITLGTLYKIIFSLIIDKYLALELGVEKFGEYKFGITIVVILSTFSTLGLSSSIVRFIAIQQLQFQRKVLISFSLGIVLLMSLLVTVIALAFNPIFNLDTPFLLATILFSLNLIYNAVFSALQKPGLKAWINDIFGYTFYLGFLWMYFQLDNSNNYISYVYLGFVGVTFLINSISVRKFYVKLSKESLSKIELKKYFDYSTPLYGVSILIVLSTHLDKLILNHFVSDEQLGLYYAVFNISNLLPLILTILIFFYLPKASRFIEDGKLEKTMIVNSFLSKWMMILATMLFGIIIYYSQELLLLLYSSSFKEAHFVLKVLAFAQWINVSLGFTGQNLLALGDSKRQFYIRLISFVLGSLLLYVGVVFLDNLGAAISILITLIFSNIFQIVVLRFKHNFKSYRLQNWYTICTIFLTGIIIHFMHKLSYFGTIHFLISALIDLMIFLLVLIVTKTLNKKDLRMLRIIG